MKHKSVLKIKIWLFVTLLFVASGFYSYTKVYASDTLDAEFYSYTKVYANDALNAEFYSGTKIYRNDTLSSGFSLGRASAISIDGYYDDWEDKPISHITYGSHNGKTIHDVSLIKDDDYIYIYVKLHETYADHHMPLYAINLSINGKTCEMFIANANAQGTVDYSNPVNLHHGINNGLHPFTYYPNYSLGDAAITVSDGNPNDRMEIRVSIDKLEKVMNLPNGSVNNGSRISLNLPNLGQETIHLMGTSTGTFIGIALCVITVVGVQIVRRRKRLA